METSDTTSWSDWNDLLAYDIQNVPDSPGVYRVRQKNEPIGRAQGQSDIVYVGAATSLRRRLRDLVRGIQQIQEYGIEQVDSVAHRAAPSLARLIIEYKRLLQIQHFTLSSKDEAKEMEILLLEAYWLRHSELPPCNNQAPRGLHWKWLY